ncbi:hypothetical protein Dimus_000140 [Dionaea muscipula]
MGTSSNKEKGRLYMEYDRSTILHCQHHRVINMDKDGRLRFHVVGDKGKRKKRIQTREEKISVLANDCIMSFYPTVSHMAEFEALDNEIFIVIKKQQKCDFFCSLLRLYIQWG